MSEERFSQKEWFGPRPPEADSRAAFTLGLFVACYNEQENIRATLETVVAACREVGVDFEILVVDDASQDASVEEVRRFAREHPDVSLGLLVNRFNQGLADNYAEAAFLVRSEWYRLICGDNVEPRETLVAIFRLIGSAEILVPFYPEILGRAWSRRALSRCYTFLVNLLGGFRMKYYNGMILTRRRYVMRWHSNSHGFGFQADLLTRLLSLGLSYREVPVAGIERASGTSKALTLRNLASVAHSLQNILLRRISRSLYRHD